MTTPHTNQPPGQVGEPARRAAWHTYLALTVDLLPALRDDTVDAARIQATLTVVTTRILIWAPAWGPPGAVLAAATHTVRRLHEDGDHIHLARLLHVIALRLFRLSSRRQQRPR